MAAAGGRSRERILGKALELFSRKGYDATSVREICAASRLTKPTLYHFFGSKEGVYRALVDDTLEAFRKDLLREVQAPGPAHERLRRVARTYFGAARRQRELMRFIFQVVHNPPDSAPPTNFPRYYEAVVGLVASVVEQGVAAGELAPGPTQLRMLVFMGALGEALCGYVVIGHPELTRRLADSLVDAILDGWRPRAARSARPRR